MFFNKLATRAAGELAALPFAGRIIMINSRDGKLMVHDDTQA